MTLLDGFTLGAAAMLVAVVVLLWSVNVLLKRRQAQLARRRENELVRGAWVGLAKKLQHQQAIGRINFDMPWQDRVRAAQMSDIVAFGIHVNQPAASSGT